MKKITLLILAAMFCIGTLTLLGCADEPEVVELEPVEEVLEEANIEEEVVELEPEPEPLYFGEEIEPTVNEEELNAMIAVAAGKMSDPTTRDNLEVVLEYANARSLPNQSSYDRARSAWLSLVHFDYEHNNLQVLKAMRDSRTNSVLKDSYDELIKAMESYRVNGDIQDYIYTLEAIDASLHPEVVGERQLLPFFHSATAPIMYETEAIVSINNESMTINSAWARNQLPLQRKYQEIRNRINAGEEVSFKLMPPNLVQI